MADYALDMRITDAQDEVFRWMLEYVQHNRQSGSEALAAFGFDWQEAWQNWWDEGEDFWCN